MHVIIKQVNINKGPDGLPGRVLRACADQLTTVFTDMFNLSLVESVIPTCFKPTTIVPVPNKVKVTCLNDYRPVVLTSVAMKCFERLFMAHIHTIILTTSFPTVFILFYFIYLFCSFAPHYLYFYSAHSSTANLPFQCFTCYIVFVLTFAFTSLISPHLLTSYIYFFLLYY